MVYYFEATGVSGEIDPPVVLYMGKHKEESELRTEIYLENTNIVR